MVDGVLEEHRVPERLDLALVGDVADVGRDPDAGRRPIGGAFGRLVHGDLVPKNVRLTARPAGFGLFVFDWEYAGWGVPATDLCQFTGRDGLGADLATYAAALADSGRRFEFGKVRQLAQYGTIFRVLDNLAWALSSLMVSDSHRCLVKPISHLSIYERQMTEALRPMEWRD